MNKFNIKKIKNGKITLQIETLDIEKFFNLLWINGISVKRIKRKNIASATLEVNLNDYKKIEAIGITTNSKIKILHKKGIIFSLLKYKNRWAFNMGFLCFLGLLYYLSTFIWKIEIITEHNVSPYEIRSKLKYLGITEGINKSKVDFKKIEEELVNSSENIMWVRVRTEGAKLRVDISERQIPPVFIKEDTTNNIVAKKDGQITRIFSSSGTAVVKPGDIVKTGQLLIKGEQGKEDSIYLVPAKGQVIAKTYYEESKKIIMKGVKTERTGNKIQNYYFVINNKKIYLKNTRINFEKYDKDIENNGFVGKECYYELKSENFDLDYKTILQNTEEELYTKVIVNLDKSVKIIDKAVDYRVEGNECVVRLLVTVEENIGMEEFIQPNS